MILSVLVFLASAWLLFQVIKIAVKVTWCVAKIIACALCIISLPLLIFLVITAGGIILLLPVLLLAGALAAIKSC